MESALADVLIGRVLDGRYLVRSRIAHGGMATVYLGTDVRLDRQVALKVMHAELARDADFVNRFIGEAKSVARLSHPNIVAVFDQGADGQFLYLAMEYVPGRTLRDLLRERGWVPYSNALDIMDPILSGLAAAHRAGFVHRDVKPENVLLTGDGRVKVVDFGLARASATSGQTRVGQIIGTVAYIAPEQVTGGTTDFRTDVYAAGIMLFEMLTGRQPHTGESPLAVAYKHVNEEVPPPSVFVPGLPRAVDDLVRAATSRDPGQRPADADSFLQAARSVRAGRAAVISSAAVTAAQPVWHDGFDSPNDPAVPALPAPTDDGAGNASHTMVVSNGYLPDTYGGPGYGSQYDHHEPFLQRWLFSKRLGIVLAGLLVVGAAGLGSWYIVSGRYAALPSVTGLPEGKAISMLRADGFAADVSGSPVTDNSLAKGDVISTSPSGRAVKGAKIALTISAGPRMVTVPPITGQTSVSGAEAVLQKQGLSVSGTTNKVASTSLAVGAIAGTTPAAGTSWPVTKPVSINVVAGFPMPSLVQQNINGVQGWASQNSITLNQQQVSNSAAAGTIIAQSVPENAPVAPGSTVTVQVSSGPPEVQIPSGLTGQSFNQVQQTLTGLGFQVTGDQFGPGQRVLAISPTGQAPKGSTITVWYGF
ncbi:MAG TPA: Stk1 family PASTA domain-containing Ser/Thr kinase [Trebonia sp.]|jgi:serine/threonine protein kinase/beta-lactam-binding protein with PASTA domain|nr:Stk1 family PASTA domain-containing Ser/Thr kinase [Trebonia sp.]